MPNINDPGALTYGDDHGGFSAESKREQAKIREQREMSKTIRGEGPMSDDEFRQGVVNAGVTDWRSGISHGDPIDNAARDAAERASMDFHAAEGGRILDQQERDRLELESYRRAPITEEAEAYLLGINVADLTTVEERAEIAGQWGKLTLAEREDFIKSGTVDIEQVPALNDLVTEHYGYLKQHAQAEHDLHERAKATASRIQAYERLLAERGLVHGTPEAEAWFNDTAVRARDMGSPDINTLDGPTYYSTLTHAEVHNNEDRRALAIARMKADLLDQPTGNVMEGLTQLGANGHQSVLPARNIYVEDQVDYERAIERRLGGPAGESAQEIRAGVAARDPKTAEYERVMEQAGKQFAEAAERARARGR